MDLSIIIVNYNNLDKLANCLDSFSKINLADLKYEIIVVDNDSGDDLRLLSRVTDFKLINSDKNLGMGAGNNLGIKKAQAETILVLNPDTLVNSSAIKVLYKYLNENENVGLVGPKLLYPDGSLQYSCSKFPTFFMPILRRTFLGDKFKEKRDNFMMLDFDHKSIKEVDWLMGSCLMFKKSWKIEVKDIVEKDNIKNENNLKEDIKKNDAKKEDIKDEKENIENTIMKEDIKEDIKDEKENNRKKKVDGKREENKNKKKEEDGVFNVLFDDRYFMYFEDIDICRQVKLNGKKVMYNPNATIIHDHARDSAKHPWYIALFRDKITWIHISSWFKYFLKWGFKN